MIVTHRSRDDGSEEAASETARQQRMDALRKEARAMRDLLAREQQRRNRKGQELKSNITDNAGPLLAEPQT